MAEQPIKSGQIVEKGVLDPLIADTKTELALLTQMDKVLVEVAKNAQKAAKGFSAGKAGDIKTAIAEEKKLSTALIEQEKVKRAKIQTEKTLLSLNKQKAAQTARQIKNAKDLTNAYKQESKELNDLRNAYKQLAAAGKENGKVARGMLKEITRLDTKLKSIDKTVGQSQRNVGNYSGAFNKLGGAVKNIGARFIAFTAILYGVGRVITSSFKTFAEFQQGSANLAAVLGKSRKEIVLLTDDAKRLGASTAFTAKQVTDLQVALSKLGFEEDDILKATGAILDLAAATGTDLAQSATVTANVMKGFNLDADQTQRVVDVMAKSFSSSALDMEKFSSAMSNVAPAARVVGLSIEETTAILGTLVDTGIDASKAGTDLRAIFQKLKKDGNTWGGAMEKVANSTDKLKTATELFGDRAAVSGVIISENSDHLKELKDDLNNAGGAAKEMADTQLDTLSGATTRLSSAWEGFILSLEDGDGVIAKVLRGAIDLATEFLAQITKLTNSVSQNRNLRLSNNTAQQEQLAIASQKEQNKLLTLHENQLKKIVAENGKQASSAKTILALREKGWSIEQQAFILSSAQLKNAKDLINEEKKAMEGQVFKLSNELEIARLQGVHNVELGETKKILESLNLEQLKQLGSLAKSGDEQQKFIGKYAIWEIQRRKQTKGLIEDNKEIGSSGEKALTGLAKLQKELNDLEKERSDYLVANGGEIDEQYIQMTNQTRELENQIRLYNNILDKSGKIQKVEKRDSSISTSSDFLVDDTAIVNGEVVNTTTGQQSQGVVGTGKTDEELLAEFEEKQKKIDKAKRKQARKDFMQSEELANSMQAITDITNLLTDQRIKKLDELDAAEQRNYDNATNRIAELTQMRTDGAANVEESLAYEKEAQAKAFAEQQRIAKKKQRLELINSGLNLMNSKIQAGDQNSVTSTLADVTTLIAGLNSLPAFWSGTDTTVGDAIGVKYSNKRDGILARVDESEMILNKDKTDKLAAAGLVTTDGIVKSAISYQMGMNDTKNTSITQQYVAYSEKAVTNKLGDIENQLKSLNSKPTYQGNFDNVGTILRYREKETRGNSSTTRISHFRKR